MKIVIATDSFKGSLSATEAADAMAKACKEVFDAEIISIPMADGGEGTLDALLFALGGKRYTVDVISPYGESIKADYGVIGGNTAVIEMAQPCGITLSDRREPLIASSYGLGQVIKAAYENGYSKMMVGIGGSSTNDGGMGMLTALGAKFYDKDGKTLYGSGAELGKVSSCDLDGLPKLDITVICDVTNPLLGKNGATAIYGPQKGVSKENFDILENGMANFSAIIDEKAHTGCEYQGAGAAGGVGFALVSVLGAKMRKGIEAVIDATGLEDHIKDASLVLTGEGRLDLQSVRFGKVVSGISKICEKYDKSVIAFAGSLGDGAEEFLEYENASMFSISNGAITLDYAMKNAYKLLHSACLRVMRTAKMNIM